MALKEIYKRKSLISYRKGRSQKDILDREGKTLTEAKTRT